MNGVTDRTWSQRIEALESEVETQRRRLRYLEGRLDDTSGGRNPGEGIEARVEPARPGAREGGSLRRGLGLPEGLFGLRSWEWWLNKVGIGLLLFGVAFLFKFSVDQGWLTPEVRVGIGLAIGTTLVGIGLRVYGERRAFSQVLLGGGIGTFYITGFAAFQLYALVAYPVAFAFMVTVTLLAFALALRQNGVTLAMIGAAGGLGTPFVLYAGAGTLGGLVLYTCLLLAGVCAIYLYKGWRSLLLFSSAGVWMVFLVGYDNFIYFPASGAGRDLVFLQLGVLFAWIALWGVSVARAVLRSRDADRWGFPEPGRVMRKLFASGEHVFRSGAVAHLLSVASPLLALAFTGAIWDPQKETLGLVALGGGAIYALAAAILYRVERDGRLFYTHALVALVLSTLSLVLILEGDALFFTLVAEAALLHLVSRRLLDGVLSALAHLLFLAVGTWLSARLAFGAIENSFFPEDAAFFDVGTWVDLVAIVLSLGVSGFVAPSRAKRIYGIAAHVALLGWLWRELGVLPDSDAYISLAWGVYAVGLLVVGLRLDRAGVTRLGLATLFVVVGKLFLVDLAWVGAVWRILLFLGFGGLFLVLSYYLQALWRPGQRTGAPEGAQPDTLR